MGDSVRAENAALRARLAAAEARIENLAPGDPHSQEEAEFRRAVIKRAAEGICVCHAVSAYPYVRFTIWNDRMRSITGYSMEEINRDGWYQCMYPDPEVQARAVARMERMRQGDDLFAEEWEITRKDGNKRVLSISTSLLKTGDGLEHVLALMHDFTAEKRAREALHRAHEELEVRVVERTRELAEANAQLQREIGERNRAEHQLRAANSVLEAVMQVQRQFLVEADPHQTFARMLALLLESTDSEYGFLGEIHVGADGQPYLKTHAISDIAWSDETYAFYQANAPAGLEFRNLNTLFGAAISTRAPVIANDPAADPRRGGLPEGHPELRAFAAIPFFHGDEMIGLVGLANRSGGYGEADLEELAPVLATCASLVHAYRLECQREQAEHGRRELEAQLRHAQKLESLGLLAGGIAHDFNNLLTGILGCCDMASYELAPGSRVRQFMERAIDSAHRASELTQQMLAYSGKGRFVVEPLSLSTLTEDMRNLLQISISKKCELRLSLMPDLPAVEADAAQLRQIIMNLVINASEAYGDGSGVIEVNTGVMHCDLSYLSETYLPTGLASGMYVYLEVTDTGCGMSEETRARAFDPFFSKKFTGRGLGLSAVLGIARGHGGTIKCESEPGRGTTFRVLLPSTSQHPTAQEQRGEVTTRWRGSGTVLVVDDEEAVRALARDMLETLGFDVLTASDGLEGVERFRSDPEGIRLVLLDMTMPHFDGAETYREIQCIRKDAPTILTSGYDEHSVTCRFTGEDKPGFLHKPYRFEDLKRAVRDALGDGCIGGAGSEGAENRHYPSAGGSSDISM